MNLNHNPDAHLLEQIDKRLTTQQPSDSSAVDELANTVPVPREAFQQALEARLLAKMQTLPEGETITAANSAYLPVRSVQRSWLPLTLLAAMLVIIVAAGIIFVGGRPSPSEVSLAQQSTTATATPIAVTSVPTSQPFAVNLPTDRTSIEVPLALLTEDSLMPKVGDSVDILALLPFSGSLTNIADVPATALPDGTRLVEKFVVFGAVVLAGTEQGQTLVFSVPSDESRLLAWLVEQGIMFRLQALGDSVLANLGDRRIISIPIANVTATGPIQVGDAVDIYSTCTFVAVFGVVQTLNCDQAPEEKQADGVVIFGEWFAEAQPRVNTESIGIAVSPDVYTHLTGLTTAEMHFKLVKAGMADNRVLVPDGKVAISVPMTSLKLLEGENFALGDIVDVITTYSAVDVGTAPGEFQQPTTPESEPDVTAKEWTSFGAKGAQILTLDQEVQPQGIAVASLAVTPQEAVVLTWVLDLGNSLTLRKSNGNPAPASPYTLQLPLDALAHWTTDALTVGDRVDLVMGFVLGNDEQVTMNFQPYATYTWGDALSQGEISAQIYAPVKDTPFGAVFLRRVIHGAVITSMRISRGATTGRLTDALVILELPAGTSSRTLEEVQGFIEAGMPYLLLKP